MLFTPVATSSKGVYHDSATAIAIYVESRLSGQYPQVGHGPMGWASRYINVLASDTGNVGAGEPLNGIFSLKRGFYVAKLSACQNWMAGKGQLRLMNVDNGQPVIEGPVNSQSEIQSCGGVTASGVFSVTVDRADFQIQHRVEIQTGQADYGEPDQSNEPENYASVELIKVAW